MKNKVRMLNHLIILFLLLNVSQMSFSGSLFDDMKKQEAAIGTDVLGRPLPETHPGMMELRKEQMEAEAKQQELQLQQQRIQLQQLEIERRTRALQQQNNVGTNTEAVAALIEGAKGGEGKSQHTLGFLYESGSLGMMQKYIYAHMWYNIAASNGTKDSLRSRDNLAKKMTAGDISKAQQLARECVAKDYKGC